MAEKLQFKISSYLKDVIGKDLITDDFVAIFELVKNSFDASAKTVNIIFDLNKNSKSKIFIIDDGKGMSKKDILDKWIFLAYSAKKEGIEDKIRRRYSGFKGIGRFSCDRLGKKLKMQSKLKSISDVHCVYVNWLDFEKNSRDEFINIDIEYSQANNFELPQGIKNLTSGVILEIDELRDRNSWNRDKLVKLKRSLQKLLDPISNDKNIILRCDNEIKNDIKEEDNAKIKNINPVLVNGRIENTIFNVLENKTTKLKAEITQKGFLEVELIDRGVFIYKTQENVNELYPELVDSEFYADISFLNQSAKTTFAYRMGIPVIRYGSLFLLRNGFRVYPVGEEGNDYWGLDNRKQQGYARFLGSRDILGFVKISGGEEKFRESTSRDKGLIQTKAANELSSCIKKCITKLEAYVVDITWQDKLDKFNSDFERMNLDENRYRIIELIEKISNSKDIKILDYNRNLVSILNEKASNFEPSLKKLKNIANILNNNDLNKQISLAEKALMKSKIAEQEAERLAEQEKEARKKAEKKAEDAIDQVKIITNEKDKFKINLQEEIKRNLFLTGSSTRDKELLEGFIHQIILYASQSKALIHNILQYPEELKKMSFEEIKESFSELLSINEKIISTSRFATSANFRLKSSKITEDLNIFIKEYLDKIATAYNTQITIKHQVDNKAFKIKFNPIEMGIVFENLISNAKKAKASTIIFLSNVKPNILEIIVEDNGKGISKDIVDKNRIFEKGFTRTDGSGLGLYFCKNIIEKLGGDFKLPEDQPSQGAKFLIKVVN